MKSKRFKQIFAIIGLVIIAGLYLTTLGLAIAGNEHTKHLFVAGIVCTVAFPVLLYIFGWIYKVVKKEADQPYAAIAKDAASSDESEK